MITSPGISNVCNKLRSATALKSRFWYIIDFALVRMYYSHREERGIFRTQALKPRQHKEPVA